MQAKSFLLAAALITLPAAATFAQSATQPAPMDGSAATPAPTATGTGQPSQADSPQTTASPSAGPTIPATPADVKAGASVYDVTGTTVGTIESVTSAGAVVFTGTARAQIALASFSKNAQGLVIGMTKLQLQAAVAAAAKR